MRKRGVGLLYALYICAFAAFIASFQVQKNMELLRSLDLGSVVTQIPASYVSADGTLSPINEADNVAKILYNKDNAPVIAYNLSGDSIPNAPSIVPITITAKNLVIYSADGYIYMPWKTFFGDTGGAFEPLQTAQAIEQGLNTGWVTVWVVVTFWLYLIILLGIFTSALVIRLAYRLFFKTMILWRFAIKIASYGSTICVILLLLQFYFHIPLSYFLLSFLPSIYGLFVIRYLKDSYERSVKDVDYALNSKNPFIACFISLSYINVDYLNNVEEFKIDKTIAKEESKNNLQRFFAIAGDYGFLIVPNPINGNAMFLVKYFTFQTDQQRQAINSIMAKVASTVQVSDVTDMAGEKDVSQSQQFAKEQENDSLSQYDQYGKEKAENNENSKDDKFIP